MLRGNFGDRGLLYVCLILASMCGLMIVGVGAYKSYSAQVEKEKAELIDSDNIGKLAPNISALVEVITEDVSREQSFVVFETGTVVMIMEPCEDPEAEARRALENSAKNPIFQISKVGNDYALRFDGPVFSRIGGRAVQNAHESILNQWENFLNDTEKEIIKQKSEEPDFLTKVGLVTRSFMLRDSKDQKIVKILKARPASAEAGS